MLPQRLLIGLALVLLGIAGSRWLATLSLLNAAALFVGVVLVFDGWARRGITQSNDDTEFARRRMANMIRKARRHILLTSKSLCAAAYVDWNDGAISKLLAEQIAKGLEIEIISGQIREDKSRQMVKEWLALVKTTGNKNVRVYLFAGDPVPNGLLIDHDRELRMETPHAPNSPRRQNVYIKNPGVAVDWFLTYVDRYKARTTLIQDPEQLTSDPQG